MYEFYGWVRFGRSDEPLARKVLTNGYSEALSKVRKVSIIGEFDEIAHGYGNWRGLADEEYVVPAKHMNIAEIPETYQIIGQVLATNNGAKAA